MTASPPPSPAAIVPRRASTTLIVRNGESGLEVLMVRRSLQASFMPGACVFPGGAVDASDADSHWQGCDESPQQLARRIGTVTGVEDAALGHAVAALRECFEECGLWLCHADQTAPADGWPALRARLHAGEPLAALAAGIGARLATSALQPWSRWITPAGMPKRFDTLFFVVRAPCDQLPQVDAGETTELTWIDPRTALAEQRAGRFPLEFATLRTVESLLPFAAAGADALIAHAAAQTVLPVLQPRLQRDGTGRVIGILMPDQPGYEAAA